MSNIYLSKFNFTLIPKKVRRETNKKLLTKLIRGLCLKINGEYKIQIDAKNLKPDIIDESKPDVLILDFTKESYELKGVTSVFSREPDEKGRYTRYIRTLSQAKIFPGDPKRYVPFCKNWICNGYIVKCDGKLMFEFNDCIGLDGYTIFKPEEDE